MTSYKYRQIANIVEMYPPDRDSNLIFPDRNILDYRTRINQALQDHFLPTLHRQMYLTDRVQRYTRKVSKWYRRYKKSYRYRNRRKNKPIFRRKKRN